MTELTIDMFTQPAEIAFDEGKARAAILGKVFHLEKAGLNGFTYCEFKQWQYSTLFCCIDKITNGQTHTIKDFLDSEVHNFNEQNQKKYPAPSDRNCFYVPSELYQHAANLLYDFAMFLASNRKFLAWLISDRILYNLRPRIF